MPSKKIANGPTSSGPNFFRYIDPQKRFSLAVPVSWTLMKSKDGQNPTSFSLKNDYAFQISCVPIKDHHKQLIEANQLQPQKPNQPVLSFVERFQEGGKFDMYMWLCIVESHLIIATYTLDNASKLKVPPETPSIRSSLSTFRFHGWIREQSQANNKEQPPDLEDISSWNNRPLKFLEFMSEKNRKRKKSERAEFADIDILNLYSLLKITVSPEPNGFFSLVREGFPIDNMIWWDYVFESEKGFVHIWRTANLVEALYVVNDPTFNLGKFLENNIKKHIDKIQKTKKTYTKYISYINQYRSYKDCVEYLWKEISDIDISFPPDSITHLKTVKEAKGYPNRLRTFVDNSIRFHTLGKSLVLNAAFEIESFLNLIIRVGATEQLRDYNDVLNKYLKTPFPDRLKNMKFYSQVITSDVDIENKAIKDAVELMNLRNKYVHFDENSSHNRLKDVYFDHDFPLHEISNNRPGVEAFKLMFHTPDLATVKKVYEQSTNFITYITSLFLPEAKQFLTFLLNQNPIGYNTVTKSYAVIYKEFVMEFIVMADKKRKPSRKKTSRLKNGKARKSAKKKK
jgi:hypothetical protein